ncbi:F510_1955 family glycosylhydrolase [Aquisalibacillus elongatus]|uniref:Beta-barrel assembly machine subunit BamC n=1 Tax=Aquisalibacillus elongatus TaxID=485577 RepID=A0A3N5C9W3_9BACI|nr:hypothetical protein [Aquisalibacillus elongatus]RPF53481.1 hypothetical protein EDC24_1984 [Aquisalibacillus elongatus]
MKSKVFIIIGIISLLVLIGCSADESSFEQKMQGDQLTHVHGLGYTEEGRLLFGTHAGLKYYDNEQWYETNKNINDYMGFNVVDRGFYTSGHPSAQSDLPNPIGLQRSLDGGKTLESLGFVGETDFHLLAVGYSSHDIFLYNPKPNSELKSGFYISKDEGDTWKNISVVGVKGEYVDLAIHPTNSNLLAIATTAGVYFSEDGGVNFNLLTNQEQGTGLFFNEQTLIYASFNGEASLTTYKLETKEKTVKNLPDIGEDAPKYIAQNPNNEDEYVIYTYSDDIFISKDHMESWDLISRSGSVQ